MNEPETLEMAAATLPRRPRWALIGIVAASTIVVVLVAIVGFRLLLSNAPPPLGATPTEALVAGSCLEQGQADLEEYTVIDCSNEHPQQVVASIDLSVDMQVYSQFSAVTSYAQEVCNRFIEYGLYVRPDVKASQYALTAIGVPSEQQYADGRTHALCAIASLDGTPLSIDLYQPLP